MVPAFRARVYAVPGFERKMVFYLVTAGVTSWSVLAGVSEAEWGEVI